MDANAKKLLEMRINKVIANLEKNNMTGIYVTDGNSVAQEVKKLLCDGDTVAVGGSMTLFETGIIDLLRSGSYKFLDRYQQGLGPDDIMNIYRQSFCADAYLVSSNAITENGELYNVDGNSNRVAAMLFGPKKVIVVAGYNKIVHNIDEAITRVKTKAAPANSIRLNCDTPCSKTGNCVSLSKANSNLCDGCMSDDRICANYTVMSKQRRPGRVFVILVGEELGY